MPGLALLALVLMRSVAFATAEPGGFPSIEVTEVKVVETGSQTQVVVHTNGVPTFTSYKLEKPLRLVVDISHARLGVPAELIDAATWAVSEVSTREFRDAERSLVRIVLGLRREAGYDIRASAQDIVIMITPFQARPAQAGAAPKSGVDTKNTLSTAPVPRKTATPAHPLHAKKPSVAQSGQPSPMRVRAIRFEDGPDASLVLIDLDGLDGLGGASEPTLSQVAVDRPALDFYPAVMDAKLARTIDVSEFGGPLKRFSTFTTPEKPDTVRVLAETDPGLSPTLERKASRLVWRFPKSPAADIAVETFSPVRVGPFAAAPLAQAKAAAAASNPSDDRKHFDGRRIDVDFKDVDIHNLLRLFSEVGQVNIITSDDVAGRVTIRMRNVPWDQAMDVALRAKGLGQARDGNLIRVAPLAALEKERESEIARMRQQLELKELRTRIIPISYGSAADMIEKGREFMSTRGRISSDGRTNVLIVRDITEHLDLVEELVRNLDTQTPQVLIEARIVEAAATFSRDLGIQWGGSFSATQATGNPTGLVFPNELGIAGGATPSGGVPPGLLDNPFNAAQTPNFAVDLPAGGPGGGVGIRLGNVSGTANLALRLNASEAASKIRILASPRIMTLDNKTARIVQGVSIPFSTVSAAGTATQFQEAALTLTTTPHVTTDGAVVMKLTVTRNGPSPGLGARGEPGIERREVDTEMLVRDGDTAVIGGIYQKREDHVRQGVPGLMNIPILGFFFRHQSELENRSELLIFVTPRIVNRAEAVGR